MTVCIIEGPPEKWLVNGESRPRTEVSIDGEPLKDRTIRQVSDHEVARWCFCLHHLDARQNLCVLRGTVVWQDESIAHVIRTAKETVGQLRFYGRAGASPFTGGPATVFGFSGPWSADLEALEATMARAEEHKVDPWVALYREAIGLHAADPIWESPAWVEVDDMTEALETPELYTTWLQRWSQRFVW